MHFSPKLHDLETMHYNASKKGKIMVYTALLSIKANILKNNGSFFHYLSILGYMGSPLARNEWEWIGMDGNARIIFSPWYRSFCGAHTCFLKKNSNCENEFEDFVLLQAQQLRANVKDQRSEPSRVF